MLSWQLWNTFQRPPRDNPVFRWTLTHGKVDTRDFKLSIVVAVAVITALGFVAITTRLLLVNMLLFILNSPAIVVGGVVVVTLLYCTGLCGAISNSIHRLRELQVYDMLCLTPPGIFGVTWLIAAAISHRRQGFFWFRLLIQTIVGSLIIGMILTLFVTLVVLILSHSQDQAVAVELVNVVMLCLALYVGCVQAFSNSVLTGMLAPLVLSENMPLYVITIGLYLMVETYIILMAGLAGMLVLPAVLQAVNISGFGVELALPVLRVVVFCGLHEISNRAVWRMLRKRLNAAELMPVL